MNSSLTPQLRADKNGKLVTRHIKNDAAGTGSASSLPAPKLGFTHLKEVSREEKIEEVAKLVAAPPANPTRYTKTPSLSSATGQLEDFTDDSVIDLVAEALNDPERHQYTKSFIASSFYYSERNLESLLKLVLNTDKIFMTIEHYGGDMKAQMNSDLSNLHSSMGFKDSKFKGPVTDEHVNYFKATLIANKLGIQESGFPIKVEYYQRIEQIKNNLSEIEPMLPVLVPVLSRDYYKESYEDIVNVMDQVKASGHHPTDIGNVMKERGTHDFGLVEEILGNGVPAVSSGVL